MPQARILAFAGSLRRGSFNKMLVRAAAQGVRDAGGLATVLDLRDFPLPVFDEDLEKEQEVPEPVRRLKDLFRGHDGLLISAPEYNSSISGVLKNTLDWLSRTAPGEKPLECFEGKVAALMAASPGNLGGLRGLVTVRSILGNIRVLVLPQQVAVPRAHEAFGPDGSLKDPKVHDSVMALAGRLVEVVTRLRP